MSGDDGAAISTPLREHVEWTERRCRCDKTQLSQVHIWWLIHGQGMRNLVLPRVPNLCIQPPIQSRIEIGISHSGNLKTTLA